MWHAADGPTFALKPVAKGRPAMLSQETLEQYRRMTGIERLKLSLNYAYASLEAYDAHLLGAGLGLEF